MDPGAFSDGRPPRGPSGGALLLCRICSGSALLGDLLAVSRSREHNLSVLLIYRRIFTLRAKLSGAVYCYRSCLFATGGRADGRTVSVTTQ